VTKRDLIERIQAKTGMSNKESTQIIEAVFSIMKNTLESGETLKISGFGSFEVKHKADRLGRNPQTGEVLTIAARRVLTFKPGSVLRQAINGGAE
jgi:integration host factor subunit alpha